MTITIPRLHDTVIINCNPLTKRYVENLSANEREAIVPYIFDHLRSIGFLYPDDTVEELRAEFQRLLNCNIDTITNEIFNNHSIGTSICHYFCHSFFSVTEPKKKNLIEVFNDNVLLNKTIRNRLGLDWLLPDNKGPGVNESFNLTYKQFMFQGPRSQRLVAPISIFKPNIAKWIVEKFSSPGDIIGDYSCGFGARMLAAMVSGRHYRGTDPLTALELESMAKFFNYKNYKLISSGSETFRFDQNEIDLYWSSPPYVNAKGKPLEHYSDNDNQAYNKGKDYFYNVYWNETLKNIQYALKPNGWFGLNILDNMTEMLMGAKEIFGEPIITLKLRTVRSHLNKTAGINKFEPVFMFRNNK